MHSLLTADYKSRFLDAKNMWHNLGSSSDGDSKKTIITKYGTKPPTTQEEKRKNIRSDKTTSLTSSINTLSNLSTAVPISTRECTLYHCDKRFVTDIKEKINTNIETVSQQTMKNLNSVLYGKIECDKKLSSKGEHHRPTTMLPLQPKTSRHRNQTSTIGSSSNHSIRSYNQPNAWIGRNCLSKPQKRSWEVKKIVDLNMNKNNTKTIEGNEESVTDDIMRHGAKSFAAAAVATIATTTTISTNSHQRKQWSDKRKNDIGSSGKSSGLDLISGSLHSNKSTHTASTALDDMDFAELDLLLFS